MDKVGKAGEGARIRLGLRPLQKEDKEIIEHQLGHGYYLDTSHTGRMQKESAQSPLVREETEKSQLDAMTKNNKGMELSGV